ncbi:MAG: glycosyltransferase family 2 protein [Elusimicrobiota bacterium]
MDYQLSVIIPCYNEKNTILKLLELVRKVPISKEIIIVCDGSTDGTRDLLTREIKKAADDSFCVVFHETNKGKGASIQSGLKAARGKIVITQDADLELNPEDYIHLLRPFKNDAEVVFGTRFANGYGNMPSYSKFANWCVTFLANILFNANISDEACGYKVMNLELYKSLNLECEGFDICPEITAKVCRKNIKIHEVPVKFNPRSFHEGKKIHWRHGFEAVWKLLKYRFINI